MYDLLMEFKKLLKEFRKYNKERIKKIILYSVIGFYFLFLFFYNLHRIYGFSVELSWFNGIISALIATLVYLVLFDLIGFLLKAGFKKNKLKISEFMAIIGAFMLLFAGLIGANNLIIKTIMKDFPWIFLAFLMPLILSIFGLLGVILVLLGKKYGKYFIFIAGLVAVIGMFIPIFKDLVSSIPLVLTLIYVDPFLLLIGGTLGFILKE